MAPIAHLRAWLVLFLLAAIVLVDANSARAERIDINDASLLGPVLISQDLGDSPYQNLIAEVRYAAGVYSYVYAAQSNPYFPGTSCCEAGIVSFAVTGHPLENTWGAILGSDEHWPADFEEQEPGQTRPVERITPVYDGFLVVPERAPGRYTAVYMQSVLPPSAHGILTYTGRVIDYDHDPDGRLRIESFQRDNVLTPVPEPSSIVLFGFGLAMVTAKRRAISRGLRDRPVDAADPDSHAWDRS
jgi:hypothetical protein